MSTLIGRYAYPKDNSYSHPPNKLLAGTAWFQPKRVLVLSEPYLQLVNTFQGSRTHEFVNVACEGQEYRILNYLKLDDTTINTVGRNEIIDSLISVLNNLKDKK